MSIFHWRQLIETYPGDSTWLQSTRLINDVCEDVQHDI